MRLLRSGLFVAAFFVSGIVNTEASLTSFKTSQLRFVVPTTYSTLDKDERRQVDCLAKNIYYEARGESYQGQLAVAAVTMNRIRSKDFPSDVCKVVFQKVNGVFQFSWVGQKRLYNVDERTYNGIKELAVQVFSNYDEKMDNTNGSIYFHSVRVNPKWKNVKRVKRIGRHVFYKESRG